MRVGAHQMSASRLAFRPGGLFCFCFVLLSFLTATTLSAREIQVSGRAYVDLGTVAQRFGMQGYWLAGYETYRLKSRWTTIDAGKNAKTLQVNRLPVYLGFPMVESRGQLFIAKADYQHVLQSVLTPQAFRPVPGLRRIVIDAGHGGKDSGARNDAYGLKEKELTLDVSRRLKSLLERAGYDVVMTRDSDVYIPLDQRPKVANRTKGDLFLSLHFNAAGSSTAAGFESYALTPQYQASSKYAKPEAHDNIAYTGNKQDAWNTLISYHVQRALVQRLGGPDRGLKRARFLVLKHLDCPGVLVELGFVSHPDTAQKLRTAAFRQTLAQSLFEGIVAYRNRLARIQ
ncbi:MAG: N-acetylmuramoyl-L-alanine amidase [Opitutales bacterium]|nr:N-acetylmuramoyl-L-alanine amidase [Opitutales bacterium]